MLDRQPKAARIGRWTIPVTANGALIVDDELLDEQRGDRMVPVVPCDEAAIERAARALYKEWLAHSNMLRDFEEVREGFEEEARRVLAAAGRTDD